MGMVKVKRYALKELLLKIKRGEGRKQQPDNMTCIEVFEEKTLHQFLDGNETCKDMKDIVTYPEVQGAYEKSKEKVQKYLREKGKGKQERHEREKQAPRSNSRGSLLDMERGLPEDDEDNSTKDGKLPKHDEPGTDEYIMPRVCEKCTEALIRETEGYEKTCDDMVFLQEVVRSMARSVAATCAKTMREGRPKAKEAKKDEKKKDK